MSSCAPNAPSAGGRARNAWTHGCSPSRPTDAGRAGGGGGRSWPGRPRNTRSIPPSRGTASDADTLAWRDEIDRALAALSPPLREAFLLKHVEGLEYRDMATITGASMSALKMRVTRACEQLREHLKETRP